MGKLTFEFEYHTCYKPELDFPDTERFEGERIVALKNDLRTRATGERGWKAGLPVEFAQCDVFLAGLPWHTEYGGYHKRASVTKGDWTHRQFIMRVGEVVIETGTPTVLMVSAFSARDLPSPRHDLEATLGTIPCRAFCYGLDFPELQGQSEERIARLLAGRFGCVGDWVCGYANSARFFLQAGKRAVVSDFNGKCIGWVAAKAAEWAKGEA